MQKFALILIFVFFSACSHVQSGKYVRVKKGDTIESLAKRYNLDPQDILAESDGKPIQEGSWIFVPQKRGILAKLRPAEMKRAPSSVERLSLGKLHWPVPSSKTVSSEYGIRWGKRHEGIDIPAREGAYFVSVDDGVVVYSGNQLGGYGNLLVIGHKNGIFTIYAHGQKLYVKKGQKVFRGQVIGRVGKTGRASGPHLHFEIRKYSRAVDPLQYMAKI